MSYLATAEKPDYIAVHCYTTTFDHFRDVVTAFHDAFKLPVLVTEFAMTVRRRRDHPYRPVPRY